MGFSLDKAIEAASSSATQKTLKGAILLVLTGWIGDVQAAIVAYPDQAFWLEYLLNSLNGGLEVVQWATGVVGGFLMTVGPLHKVVKFIKNLLKQTKEG